MMALALAVPLALAAGSAIDCVTTGRDLPGGAGATITVVCPPGCPPGDVWGTSVYTDDSAVCTAAQHAGAMSAGGGEIVVRIGGQAERFAASVHGGVTSQAYGRWERTFSFPEADKPTSAHARLWIDALKPWVLIALAAAVFYVLWRRRRKQVDRMAAALREIATARGLRFERLRRRVAGSASGALGGHAVTLHSYLVVGGGRERVASHYVEVDTRFSGALPAGFRAFPRTLLGAASQLFAKIGGERELASGHPELDALGYLGVPAGTDFTPSPALSSALLEYFRAAEGWELLVTHELARAYHGFAPVSRDRFESLLARQRAVADAARGGPR